MHQLSSSHHFTLCHFLSVSLFTLAFLVLPFGGSSLRAADTEYWNEFIFAFDLHADASMEVGLEQQFIDQGSTFSLCNISLVPSFRLTKTTSAGFGYRHEREKEDGVWTTEDRYWLHYSVKRRLGEWTLKVKPQLEYRNLAERDVWLARPKLYLQHPVKIGSTSMTATLAGDPYYHFDTGTICQKRISTALTFDLDRKTECSVFYLRKLKRSGDDWKKTHVIGTEIAFSF
ncbi:MAG: hypothetical protein BWY66_01998 [bacterium ADurb.Bin374]|nr:MAG: hypothetical protein BWY66_01998 [bacterium ADurb.Bin374]